MEWTVQRALRHAHGCADPFLRKRRGSRRTHRRRSAGGAAGGHRRRGQGRRPIPTTSSRPPTSAHGSGATAGCPAGCCVAMHAGWGRHRRLRRGSSARTIAAASHFPGFHPEADRHADAGASGVRASPSTRISLDHGRVEGLQDAHTRGCPRGAGGSRAVANLDRVPARGATLVVGAPKIRGATGGPTRVLALV